MDRDGAYPKLFDQRRYKREKEIQGCSFGPESKPNPGNQYLDGFVSGTV